MGWREGRDGSGREEKTTGVKKIEGELEGRYMQIETGAEPQPDRQNYRVNRHQPAHNRQRTEDSRHQDIRQHVSFCKEKQNWWPSPNMQSQTNTKQRIVQRRQQITDDRQKSKDKSQNTVQI
jgi:hypothetical protein